MLNQQEILTQGKSIITEESQDLSNLAANLDNSFTQAIELITNHTGRVIVIGIGKSGHIGAKIAATLASTGTPAFSTHPAELLHGDLGMITSQDICLLISNSGETSEIINIIPHLNRRNIPIISITSKPQSTLAKLSQVHLNTCISKEAGHLSLAPTSSTTATLALGDALALVTMECKDFSSQDFAEFHPGGSLGRQLMRLSDIKTGDTLPVLSVQASYTELLESIAQYSLGMVCIVESNNQLINIITDGDLRRAQIKYKQDIFSKTVEDLVQGKSRPRTIINSELAFTAKEIMQDNKISSLVIVNNSEESIVTGVITLQELLAEGI